MTGAWDFDPNSSWKAEQPKWRLPWPVRPWGHETRESYFCRLMAANYIDTSGLRFLTQKVVGILPEVSDRPREATLELLAGLRQGYLDQGPYSDAPICSHQRCRCGDGVANDRYLCIQCANGEVVAQSANLEPYVCVKHWRWVGPGVKPEDQTSVREVPRFRSAARRHRALLSQGRFDPVRFRAIWGLLSNAYQSGDWAPAFRADVISGGDAKLFSYPAAVSILRLLEDNDRLSHLLNPRQESREVERQLQEIAKISGVAEGSPRIARLLRYHLRPDFYRVAKATTPGWHNGRACCYPIPKEGPHDRDLGSLDVSAWPTLRAGIPPTYPGFDRPTSPLHIEPSDRLDYRYEHWFEYWNFRGSHKSTGPRAASYYSVWICTAGHIVRLPGHRRARSQAKGCSACAGKVAVPGVTDIATTHPDAFGHWDHSRNFGLRYWEQTAGRMDTVVDWCCPDGHEWSKPIAEFLKTPWCKRCRVPNQRRVDLPAEFPELVSWLDRSANANLNLNSIAMYVDEIQWKCPDGHFYGATVHDVMRREGNCPVCTHRRLIPGVNDFMTLYPDKAREFAVSLNGGLTADQVWPRSPKPFKFICARGHVYEVSPRERVDLDIGCTKCTGRAIIHGETDLLTLKPDVAARWDYQANVGLSPQNVHPGSSKKAFFTCLCGEPWETEIRYMRPDRYCKKCTGGLRSGRIQLPK